MRIDPVSAERAHARLNDRLRSRLEELSRQHGEVRVVVIMRDYLVSQIERWATRAVDESDSRRRAERFLAWAERPDQLEAAQRRGLFVGMDTDELRRLAGVHLRGRTTPETALEVWMVVDRWVADAETLVGDAVLADWLGRASSA
jgi:hypothetical protein